MSDARPARKHGAPRGQSTVEYVVFSTAFFGFSALGWPYLLRMLSALGRYFSSLYYIIQSPLP